MREENIRQAIRRSVDACAASARENPCLAQRVIAQANRKEQPYMKKKLPTAVIVLLALLLASLTAAAIGLTVRDVWQQSFDKMNTSGYIQTVNDYLYDFGAHDIYQDAPEGLDAAVWFADESEWDALVTEPAMTYDEFTALYGSDKRFWPMEVLCVLDPGSYRMPNPGETTLEEAVQIALEAIVAANGGKMREQLTEYEVFVHRFSLTDDPNVTDCGWEVIFVRDHNHPTEGFRVSWGEWETHTDEPYIQDINDMGNG